MPNEKYHSVRVIEEKCIGCINCIRSCPTEAMRVINGKVEIISDRCIDCGECVRICKSHALDCARGSISQIKDYDYTVVIPDPSLYAQFNNLNDTNIVLTALKELGFDRVFECSGASELVSEETRSYIKANKDQWPIISCSCPAVLRIVLNKFPSLIPNLMRVKPPIEIAAKITLEDALKETGLPRERIGIFYISPCPSKIAALIDPVGVRATNVDVSLAVKDVYPLLIDKMKQVSASPENLAISGRVGNGWSVVGGEAAGTFDEHAIAASGIENIIKILEDLEDERYPEGLKFVELRVCPNGCVGGPFNVDNPFIAASKIKSIAKYLPVTLSHINDYQQEGLIEFMIDDPYVFDPVYSLGKDFVESMQNLNRVERLLQQLPRFDCGSCGCPTCKTLAEDIIRGRRVLNNCIYYKSNTDIGSTY